MPDYSTAFARRSRAIILYYLRKEKIEMFGELLHKNLSHKFFLVRLELTQGEEGEKSVLETFLLLFLNNIPTYLLLVYDSPKN